MEKFYPEIRFGNFTRVDGTIAFYLRVNALLSPSDIVLDLGCGRGAYQEDPVEIRKNLRILSGKVSRVIGVDLDADAGNNPFIDEFRLIDSASSAWPVETNSIDLLLSDWTLEHIEDPDLFWREARRVLKPGGYVCIRTTNAWGYVALFSRIIPEKYHSKVIQKVQKGRKEEDIFPTHYSCNTLPLLKKKLMQYGFSGIVLGFSGEPAYLNFSCVAYYLGILYEKFAPAFLRHTLLVYAVKKTSN
jgi:ubiquinone/menaquinone biosynthesis C-methylase UbiE